VLTAAREAAVTDPQPARVGAIRSLTDRLWESRPLRYAWAVLFATLVAVNLYLDVEAGRGASGGPIQGPAEAPAGTLTLLDARRALVGSLTAVERRPEADRLRNPIRENPS
jgi:hypothetical protein